MNETSALGDPRLPRGGLWTRLSHLCQANQGRVSVTDLPNELGVSMEHVETRVELLRKRDGSLHKVNNDLRPGESLAKA